MTAGAAKSAAFALLILNLILYGIVSFIAAWAVSFALENTHRSVTELGIPARLFPIYFPLGNLATSFFVLFSLIAGVVGIATSLAGINNILQWNVPNLLSAAASSITTWLLTFLAFGLACKEITVGSGRDSNLVAMETLVIILTITQLFCMGAIHSGAMAVVAQRRYGATV